MANSWVDFNELKQRVSIVDVLNHYQILTRLRPRKGGDELVGKCPWHQSKSSDPFRVSVSKNAFRCFAPHCARQGNIFDLVRHMEELGDGPTATRQAALLIQEWFGAGAAATPADRTPTGTPVGGGEVSPEPVEINPPPLWHGECTEGRMISTGLFGKPSS